MSKYANVRLRQWDCSKAVRGCRIDPDSYDRYRKGLLNVFETFRMSKSIDFITCMELHPGLSPFAIFCLLNPDVAPAEEIQVQAILKEKARANKRLSGKDLADLDYMIPMARHLFRKGGRP